MALYNMVNIGSDIDSSPCYYSMMTSSNRNIFRVTGPLCRGLSSHRWFLLTKASDTELFALRLNKRLSKQPRHLWFETPSRLSWRHCNVQTMLTRTLCPFDLIEIWIKKIENDVYKMSAIFFETQWGGDNEIQRIWLSRAFYIRWHGTS